MTVFEHAAQEIREGIEIAQASTGTLADADPAALVAVALCGIIIILTIIVGCVARR